VSAEPIEKSWGNGDEFACNVLAYCLKDSLFYVKHLDVITPAHFENLNLRQLCHLLAIHFKQYQRIPTHNEFLTVIGEYAQAYGGQNQSALYTDLITWAGYIYNIEISGEDFIHVKVVEFGKRQALLRAINKTLESVEANRAIKFDELQKDFDNVFRIGLERDYGVDFHETVCSLPEFLKTDSVYGLANRIPTGFRQMDDRLMGGMGTGELAVVGGPPGRGKSTFLVSIGINAARHFADKKIDKHVVHITLELHDKSDVVLMYGSHITRVPKNLIFEQSEEWSKRAEEYKPYLSKIRIKYFVPGTLGVDELLWWIVNAQSVRGINPGLVIVDYADELKGGEADRYRGMADIYSGLIAIGDRFQCPVWTGSQINREWSGQQVIKGQGMADSWHKMGKADLVLTICQNEWEEKHAVSRLYMGKVRRGPGADQIYCHHRGDIAAIWEMTLEEVEAIKKQQEANGV
jgi:hypothetical protein